MKLIKKKKWLKTVLISSLLIGSFGLTLGLIETKLEHKKMNENLNNLAKLEKNNLVINTNVKSSNDSNKSLIKMLNLKKYQDNQNWNLKTVLPDFVLSNNDWGKHNQELNISNLYYKTPIINPTINQDGISEKLVKFNWYNLNLGGYQGGGGFEGVYDGVWRTSSIYATPSNIVSYYLNSISNNLTSNIESSLNNLFLNMIDLNPSILYKKIIESGGLNIQFKQQTKDFYYTYGKTPTFNLKGNKVIINNTETGWYGVPKANQSLTNAIINYADHNFEIYPGPYLGIPKNPNTFVWYEPSNNPGALAYKYLFDWSGISDLGEPIFNNSFSEINPREEAEPYDQESNFVTCNAIAPQVIWTIEPNSFITIPFNMETITQNISNALNQTYSSTVWYSEQNINNLVEEIKEDVLNNYLPNYLKDCVNLDYQIVKNDNNAYSINWNYYYTLRNGKIISNTFTTNINLPNFDSTTTIKDYLISYLDVNNPITLYSNTSYIYDDNNILENENYILKRFNEYFDSQKKKGAIPNAPGYVLSSVNLNQFLVNTNKQNETIINNEEGSEYKYYRGLEEWTNTEIENPEEWFTNQEVSNQSQKKQGIFSNVEILTNYAQGLMSQFWKIFHSSFVFQEWDANPVSWVEFSSPSVNSQGVLQSYLTIYFKFNVKNLPLYTLDTNSDDAGAGVWSFRIPVNVEISNYAVATDVLNRLKLTGYSVPRISENQEVVRTSQGEGNHGIIIDNPFSQDKLQAEKVAPTLLFYTPVNLEFSADNDESETVWINGIKQPVINNKVFSVLSEPELFNENNGMNQNVPFPDAESNQEENINQTAENFLSQGFKTYIIQIKRNGQVELEQTVIVGDRIPELKISYFAWNPNSNPLQRQMISSTLRNGKPNPHYIKNLNPETGTVSQILWVNQKTSTPMYYDPDSSDGELIPSQIENGIVVARNGYKLDTGYLADGIVVNKGVKINFNTNSADVSREGYIFNSQGELVQSDNPSGIPSYNYSNQFPERIGEKTEISPSSVSNPYFSYSGIWEYTIHSFFSGQNENKDYAGVGLYGKWLVNVVDGVQGIDGVNLETFVDSVKSKNVKKVVEPFWETYHGNNLLRFMKNYGWTSEEVQQLNYLEVLRWWNYYAQSSFGISLNKMVNPLSLSANQVINIETDDKNKAKQLISNFIENYYSGLDANLGIAYTFKINEEELERMIADYSNEETGRMLVVVSPINPWVDNGYFYVNDIFKKTDSEEKKKTDKKIDNSDKKKENKETNSNSSDNKKKNKEVINPNNPKHPLVVNQANKINLADLNYPVIDINTDTKSVEVLKEKIISAFNNLLKNRSVIVNNQDGTEFVNLVYGIDYTIIFPSDAVLKTLFVSQNHSVSQIKLKINALSSSKYCTGESNWITVENNLHFNPLAMFNLSDLKINSIRLNLKNDKTNLLTASVWIFQDILDAFKTYFNSDDVRADKQIENLREYFVFDWNKKVWDYDNLVFPSTYKKTWYIPNYEELVKKVLSEYSDNKNKSETITFSILPYSKNNEYKAYNDASFEVSNSVNNALVPNNIQGINKNTQADVKSIENSPKWWLIGVITPIIIIAIVIIWAVWYRIKSKNILSQK